MLSKLTSIYSFTYFLRMHTAHHIHIYMREYTKSMRIINTLCKPWYCYFYHQTELGFKVGLLYFMKWK